MDSNELNQLKQTLKNGKATIEFTKVNGNRRVMVATLESTVIPITGESDRVKDPNLLVVWDTEHAGWRTIKVDSIRSWNPGEVSVPVEVAAIPTTIGGWQPVTQIPNQ